MHSTLQGLTDEELYLYERFLNNNYPSIKNEDVLKVKFVCNHHIFIEFKNGNKFIWTPLDNRFISIRNENIKSREQEIYEFKYLMRFWMLVNNKNPNDLAEYMHTTRATISRYMNCERLPDIFTIKNMADALNIKIDDLFFNY